ncbi:MAG: autotransporter-associated beta strand repeat-containing protein [Ferruginibacter sp.]
MKKFVLHPKLLTITLVIINLFLASTAFAKTTTWTPTIGGLWTTAGNWNNGLPVAGDDVIINSNQSAAITAVPIISLASLTVSGNCNLVPFASGNTITVTGVFSVSTGVTLSMGTSGTSRFNVTLGSVSVGSVDGTLNVYSTGTNGLFTNNGTLSIGSAGFIADGGGANNTDFSLSATGILKIASTTGISTTAGTGNIRLTGTRTYTAGSEIVYDGSAAQVTGNGIPTTSDITIDNPAGVTLTAALTSAGTLTITNGQLDLANTNLSVRALTGSGNITHASGAAGARTISVTGTTSPAAYSGVISNGTATSVSLAKSGSGTLTLWGLNTYTGTTTISAGTISITTLENVSGGASSLGAPTSAANGTIALTTGSSILKYTGSGHSSNRIIATSTDGSIIDASGTGTLTLTGGVTSGGGSDDVELTGTGVGAMNSVIATSGGLLDKTGAGTWIFGAANTYTGTTTVSAGKLEYGINNAISTGAVTVSGGTLDMKTFSDAVGTVTVSGGGIITGTTGVLTGSSYAVQSGTISGILGGTGALTKTTSGTVILSGTNTYTGVTTISAGILSVSTIGDGGVAGNLGAATNAAANLVLNGGTLQYTGATASTNRNYTLPNGTTSTFEITTGANTLTISGASTATSGALTKTGAGKLQLSGANGYTGTTTISAGTLSYGVSNALSNGAVIVNDGGIYDLNGFSDVIGALTVNSGTTGGSVTTGAGTLTLGGNVSSTGGAANASISGNLALAATRTFTITNGADGLTVSAIISGATFGVTKAGNGTLTFSGVNTYTGVTSVGAGTLSVGTIGNGGIAGNLGQATNVAANLVLGGGRLLYTGATASTNRAFTLTSATTSTIDISTGATVLTMSGAAAATSGSIIKAGDGSLTLSGANAYTGTTTISAGELIAGANVTASVAGPFGNAATAIVLGNASTTANNSSASLLTGGAFTIARTVTVANQTTTGTYSIGGNTDNNSTFSGLITFSKPFSVTQVATTGANTLTISGGMTGGLAGNKTVTFDNDGAAIVSTVAISNGTGTTLIRKINNGVLTMNFANTYTGGTTLDAGGIKLINTAGLGAAGQAVTLNSGALVLSTNTTVNAYNITVGGSVSIFSDRLTAGGGITHVLGTLSIGNSTLFSYLGANVNDATGGLTFGATTFTASTPVFDVSNGLMNVTLGALTGNFAFTKAGGGQLTLGTASPARTGGTSTLQAGTLKLSNASGLGTNTVPLQLNGGTLDLATDATVNAYNTTVGGDVTIMSNKATAASAGITHILGTLSIGANTLDVNQGANVTSGTAAVQFGNFTMTGAPILSPNTANLLMAGNASGAFKLTKAGTGILQKITTAWTLGGDFEMNAGTFNATTQNTTILGNWINNGGTHTASGASTVIFNGGTMQSIGGSLSTTFNNLTVDNTSGVSLGNNETVNAVVTLNNGILTIPTGNTLTIANGNAIGGSGFGATKQIATLVDYGTGAKGFVRVNNMTTSVAYPLPVGDGTNYLPVALTPSDAVTANNTYSVCVFQGITTDGEPNGTPFSAVQKNRCVDAVWTVNYNGPGTPTAAPATMKLDWPESLEGPYFSALGDNLIGIAHYGPAWGTCQALASSGNNSTNTVALDNITQFSPFAVGWIDASGGVLAIKITYFNASKGNGYNSLNWQAACSSSQAIFEIERSTDGINFTTISSITASQARCAQPFSYNDNTAPAGTVFYRIKIIDVDGKITNSAIVKLSTQSKDMQLVGVSPNPVSNIAQLKINTIKNEVVDLAIVSVDGKVVYRSSIQVQPGSSVVNMDIANLPGGIYMIKGLFSDGQTNTLKFIKK